MDCEPKCCICILTNQSFTGYVKSWKMMMLSCAETLKTHVDACMEYPSFARIAKTVKLTDSSKISLIVEQSDMIPGRNYKKLKCGLYLYVNLCKTDAIRLHKKLNIMCPEAKITIPEQKEAL